MLFHLMIFSKSFQYIWIIDWACVISICPAKIVSCPSRNRFGWTTWRAPAEIYFKPCIELLVALILLHVCFCCWQIPLLIHVMLLEMSYPCVTFLVRARNSAETIPLSPVVVLSISIQSSTCILLRLPFSDWLFYSLCILW